MRSTILALILLLFMTLPTSIRAQTAPLLHPTQLRCEYHDNPLGIDEIKPRLSWILKSDDPAAHDQKQTEYRVVVASSREKLDADQGDLWDSGQVKSDETIHIQYAGKPLKSEQECWWKVRVWNGAGQQSSWSDPARWTMGLLEKSEWKAKWI